MGSRAAIVQGACLPRHANLNDVVKRALTSAGIPAWLEPVGLDRGDGRRSDGVPIQPGQVPCMGRHLRPHFLR